MRRATRQAFAPKTGRRLSDCSTRSVNSRNTTIVSATTRVWTTGLSDRNSLSPRNTARCGVASDWADCSTITIVRQPESGDPPGSGVRWECAPTLRDRPGEQPLPDAGPALTSECFWRTVTGTRACQKMISPAECPPEIQEPTSSTVRHAGNRSPVAKREVRAGGEADSPTGAP
jgi:hypothetical protein